MPKPRLRQAVWAQPWADDLVRVRRPEQKHGRSRQVYPDHRCALKTCLFKVRLICAGAPTRDVEQRVHRVV